MTYETCSALDIRTEEQEKNEETLQLFINLKVICYGNSKFGFNTPKKTVAYSSYMFNIKISEYCNLLTLIYSTYMMVLLRHKECPLKLFPLFFYFSAF